MASTIKLKNGSGEPLASDLVQGEPALDLTNKRLYTEDSGGTVIEVGTNPTELQVDNINIDGNAITSTDTDGNITITPNGTGEVDISKVDIDSGTIDGVTIGGESAGAGTFTTITGSGDITINDQTNGATRKIFFDMKNSGGAQSDLSLQANNGEFIFYRESQASESMRINSSGNVGIGRSDNLTSKATISSTVTGDFSALNLINDEPDGSADAVILDFTLARTGGSFREAGKIIVGKEKLYDFSVNCDSYMAFHTMDASTSYERMRIDSDGSCRWTPDGTTADMTLNAGGSLLVGTTSTSIDDSGFRVFPAGSGSSTLVSITNDGGGQCLFLDTSSSTSIQIFRRSNVTVGSISVTTTSTAYNTSSDYRLKENVVDMTGAIDRVKALKPSRFNFIADPNKTVDGFLAHEAQEIVPEAVTGEKDAVDADGNPEYQGIDQSKLVPLLTGALQEAIARIETLEAQVATLQGN